MNLKPGYKQTEVGIIPEEWEVARLLGKHPSAPYNPLLANAFFLSGYIESWGRGIEKIAHECAEHGIQHPDYDSGMSGLMLTFHASAAYLALINPKPGPGSSGITEKSGVETLGKTSVKTSVKILELLVKNPEMTLAEIAVLLGKSTRAVEMAATKLAQKGRLKRIGPDKGGHWEVLK
jgi:ATP-dependent DNA helicase RecG